MPLCPRASAVVAMNAASAIVNRIESLQSKESYQLLLLVCESVGRFNLYLRDAVFMDNKCKRSLTRPVPWLHEHSAERGF